MAALVISRFAILVFLSIVTLIAASGNALAQDGVSTSPSYQSASLEPAAVDLLRRKVLVQCGIEINTASNVLPWYFHFEYGKALLEAGDARLAVIQLNQSIDLRPEPHARKRTYGMWFLDYLPYFELAEAHARLANWPCADHAMQLSQSTGEIAMGRIEPKRIHALQDSIDRHTDEVGSCDKSDYEDAASIDTAPDN